jgi:hypothetical protein
MVFRCKTQNYAISKKGDMELRNVKIEVISEPQVISEKFKKQEFVVVYDENPQYPQFVKFELVNKSVGKIDGFRPGDFVDVLFDIKGKKWEKDGQTKYFTSLQAWKVSIVGQELSGGNDFDEPPSFE